MISNLKAKLSVMGEISRENKERDNTAYRESVRIFKEEFPIGAKVGCAEIYSEYLLNENALSILFRETVDFKVELGDFLFIDTETTGLSGGVGTLAFLIGVGYFNEGSFVIEQFMMSDYDGEREILDRFYKIVEDKRVLVTFNGKSFDIPLINSRSIMNRIRQPFNNMVHLDLLHAVRRQFKLRLVNCSLSNIEKEILGLNREGDIPGNEIPAMFFDFILTQNWDDMMPVIEHNMQDIKSMPAIMNCLCNMYELPFELEHALDRYSLARICGYESKDRMMQLLLSTIDLEQAKYDLAFVLKRDKKYDEAIELFKELCSSDYSHTAYLEIAKYYEHRVKDYDKAYNIVQSYLDRLRITHAVGDEIIVDLKYRRDRLMRKIIRNRA